jgi:hypothetical protein
MLKQTCKTAFELRSLINLKVNTESQLNNHLTCSRALKFDCVRRSLSSSKSAKSSRSKKGANLKNQFDEKARF